MVWIWGCLYLGVLIAFVYHEVRASRADRAAADREVSRIVSLIREWRSLGEGELSRRRQAKQDRGKAVIL